MCAITDRNNGPPPAGLVPLVLFITILGIGAALGMQTGYAINPARDLGPRLLTSMVGYGGAGNAPLCLAILRQRLTRLPL